MLLEAGRSGSEGQAPHEGLLTLLNIAGGAGQKRGKKDSGLKLSPIIPLWG